MKHVTDLLTRQVRQDRHARLFQLHQQILNSDQAAPRPPEAEAVPEAFAAAFQKDAARSLLPRRRR